MLVATRLSQKRSFWDSLSKENDVLGDHVGQRVGLDDEDGADVLVLEEDGADGVDVLLVQSDTVVGNGKLAVGGVGLIRC